VRGSQGNAAIDCASRCCHTSEILGARRVGGNFVTGVKKVKVKCTLVQALRLCTGRTAHMGRRGIALLYRH
jgi:hypothetical protein